MKFAYLGESGLKISRIILGCMSYGSKEWGSWVIEDEAKVLALMKYAYDKGIRTFDTADVYSNGVSEILIAKFIEKYSIPRSTLVIASKVSGLSSADGVKGDDLLTMQNRCGLSRKHIMDAVNGSVERLGTYIDLYQIHRYDPRTPEYETMKALHDCIEAGKVRYIGASSMRAYEFVSLQNTAEKHNLTKFISMQNYYNLQYREEEREMIPYCNKTNVGLIPWKAINYGLLARPHGDDTRTERSSSAVFDWWAGIFQNEPSVEIRKRVEKLANDRSVNMVQIAVAWQLYKGTHPILGLGSTERIDEAVAALDVELTDQDVEFLEQPYKPMPVFGIDISPPMIKYFAD